MSSSEVEILSNEGDGSDTGEEIGVEEDVIELNMMINSKNMMQSEFSGQKRINGTATPKYSCKKMKQDDLYKTPSVVELNSFKHAEALFHSTLFRIQVKELLKEVKVKQEPSLENWIGALKAFLKKLPSTDWFEIEDKSWIQEDVKVPMPRHCENKNAGFMFLPPLDIYIVGSYATNTMCKPEPIVDLALKVPKKCWRAVDYLNEVYHRKRALYLTYLAQCLKDSDLVERLEFSYQGDCHLRPALLIKSMKYGENYFRARLLPYPESGSFNLSRFAPSKNNMRFHWFYKSEKSESENSPTPYYNSTLLQDMVMISSNEFLMKKITSEAVKDGIILLKVWSIQRGLYGGPTALNGFLISMIVTYLLFKRRINRLMSSYQVFRNVLLALVKQNWMEMGVSLCQEEPADLFQLKEFHKYFSVVFIDPSGCLNMCYGVTKESIAMLQHEAGLALKMLDSVLTNSFSLLFMDRVPFYRKFEYLVHFTDTKKFAGYGACLNLQHVVLDFGADLALSIIPKLCELVKRGLGDRVHLVGVKISSLPKWSISEKPCNPNACRQVTLGFLVNQDLLLSNLEKGPSVHDISAGLFREFWGEKAELRRFRDGSIHEAVLWHADTIEKKRCVLPVIVKYILQMHANVDPDDIICRGTDVDCVLGLPKSLLPSYMSSYGTGEEVFMTLMESFNSFTKQLRDLEGLPLIISAIQGSSSVFRFSEVFPPFPKAHNLKNYELCEVLGHVMVLKRNAIIRKAPDWVPPLEVVVQFEGSGKWPDDKDAIKRVKAALHIKIGELLRSQFGLMCNPNVDHVDVLKDSFVFRVHVACHKEISVLKQIKTDEGTVKIVDTPEAIRLQCRTEILPKLNSILHGLHQQHNSFGTACRLVKRFMSSQLFYGYIEDIILELIVAFLYIHPEPFSCPSCPQVAFLRFLAFFKTHAWETSPLLINLNGEFTQEEITDIQTKFLSKIGTLPPMVVVTPLDRSGTLWTKDHPNSMLLKRMISLCSAVSLVLEEKLSALEKFNVKNLFTPPLQSYDLLIHLRPEQIPKYCFAVNEPENIVLPPYEPYRKKKFEPVPVVGYDPVQFYLRDLRDTFSEIALFFYDTYGGLYIAVLWNPEAFKSKPFKVSDMTAQKIGSVNIDGTVNTLPHVEAVIQDIKLMGSHLVKTVEKLTTNW